MNSRIVVFDFDRTLINHDTTLGFFLFLRPKHRCFIFLHYLCLSLLKRLGVMDVRRVKLSLLNVWCRKFTKNELEDLSVAYSRQLCMNKLFDKLCEYVDDGSRVFVISASLQAYIKPLFIGMNVVVLGSEVTKKDLLNWRFDCHCWGKEKVRVLNAVGVDCIDEFYTDSLDDFPLMEISKQWNLVKKSIVVNKGMGNRIFDKGKLDKCL